MNSEVVVSNSFALIVLFGALLFLSKSVYDLIKSKNLTNKEKTNLSFLIALLPIFGSCIFYFYQSNVYRANRKLKYNSQKYI